jgi:hypothetical protein
MDKTKVSVMAYRAVGIYLGGAYQGITVLAFCKDLYVFIAGCRAVHCR